MLMSSTSRSETHLANFLSTTVLSPVLLALDNVGVPAINSFNEDQSPTAHHKLFHTSISQLDMKNLPPVIVVVVRLTSL